MVRKPRNNDACAGYICAERRHIRSKVRSKDNERYGRKGGGEGEGHAVLGGKPLRNNDACAG